MTLHLSTFASPLGPINLIADEHVLLGANFSSVKSLYQGLDEEFQDRDIKEVRKIPVISDLLTDYFDGDFSAINGIQVRQPGATFSQAAWKVMRKIPAGKTWSYAELAQRAGSPAAVRAAGTACGRNAIVLVIPCHRIVKSGGALGNYGFGVDKKEWLLRHEGAL